MSSWSTNLPPGCSSREIEDRFGDGDPDIDANNSEERCEECCLPLSECECKKLDEDRCPNCNGTGVFNGSKCKCCGQ